MAIDVYPYGLPIDAQFPVFWWHPGIYTRKLQALLPPSVAHTWSPVWTWMNVSYLAFQPRRYNNIGFCYTVVFCINSSTPIILYHHVSWQNNTLQTLQTLHTMSWHALTIVETNTKEYRIAGNFRRIQFSQMTNLPNFRGLIFADACDHAHYTLHNRTYFAGLIFMDSRLSVKTTKVSRYTVLIIILENYK